MNTLPGTMINPEYTLQLNTVKNIAAYLLDIEYAHHPGLMGGNGSLILFLAYYYLYIEQEERYADRIAYLLEKALVQASLHEEDTTLASGQSGLIWLLAHLTDAGLLDEDYRALASDMAAPVRQSFTQDVAAGHADLLQGFLGKYLALRALGPEPGLQQQMLQWYNRNKQQAAYGCYYPYTDAQTINLGLAHGLPGMGSFLLHHQEEQGTAQELADYLYLLFKSNSARMEPNLSLFSNTADSRYHTYNESYSRYAWCYGDLGILYFMARLNKELDTEQNRELLHTLLQRCNSRNRHNSFISTVADTPLLDPAFCHGLSGIYYLQQKINTLLPATLQLNTNHYWQQLLLSETQSWLQFAAQAGDQLQQSRTQDHHGMLEGISGTGLVLLSELTGQHAWSSSLLLHS